MHVTARYANLGLTLAAIFSLSVLVQAVPAQADDILWEVPIDEAWDYGISWRERPDTGGIEGYMRPQLIMESEGDVISGRIASASGDTMKMYGEESRLVVKYGYDSGDMSGMFLVTPESGEFSFEIPADYSDADYVDIWLTGHLFNVGPSGTYPESGVSTIITSPANQTSTETFTTGEGLEGTIETNLSEESTTTTDVDADEESVVTVTTVNELINETTTTTTPKSESDVDAAEDGEKEMTSKSSTTANSLSTTSTSQDGQVETVKDVMTNVTTVTDATSDDEQTVRVTTATTNSTTITTETASLGFETELMTIWDNHEYFRVDGYSIFEDEYEEHTFIQPTIRVIVNPAMTEYRLGQ